MNKVKLSSLHEGAVFRFEDMIGLWIVIDRWPEDRSSGGTRCVNGAGYTVEKWWNHEDPLVYHLGKGRIVIEVTEPNTY